jgi:sugar-specific transcriptional regulator TrmB
MIKKLQEAGLTKRESEAYLQLFNFEEATVTQLSKITKEHRTNLYDSLGGLIKKGLITYTIRNNVKYYKVGDPQNLLDFIKEKEDKIKELIPDLQNRILQSKDKPSVSVYEGKEGFKVILNKIIKEGKTILGIGASEEWEKKFPFKISQYMKRREEKNILAKLIYFKGTKITKHKLNKIKYLSSDYFNPSTIAIFGNYVAVFMWSEPLIATVTKSNELSKSFEKYFEHLWSIAKK